MKIYFFLSKLYFSSPSNFYGMNSKENSGGIDVFSVSQLENNDTSETMEIVVFCVLTQSQTCVKNL